MFHLSSQQTRHLSLLGYMLQLLKTHWNPDYCNVKLFLNPRNQTDVLWRVGYVSLQICSPAEKKAIDKMIDSGPQLAGSMEYNVVLSEYLLRQDRVNNRV